MKHLAGADAKRQNSKKSYNAVKYMNWKEVTINVGKEFFQVQTSKYFRWEIHRDMWKK